MGRTFVCSGYLSHMTMIAVMPLYGRTNSEIFSPKTKGGTCILSRYKHGRNAMQYNTSLPTQLHVGIIGLAGHMFVLHIWVTWRVWQPCGKTPSILILSLAKRPMNVAFGT